MFALLSGGCSGGDPAYTTLTGSSREAYTLRRHSMPLRARLSVIGLAVIAFSVYVGLEIDYRHWSWVIFLLVLPIALVALLVWFNMRQGQLEPAKTKNKVPKKRRR